MDNTDQMLSTMAVLTTANTQTVTQLTTLQRAEVARSFRLGIEDALSCMDDVPLPAQYHSPLLELTNTILASLSHGSAPARIASYP